MKTNSVISAKVLKRHNKYRTVYLHHTLERIMEEVASEFGVSLAEVRKVISAPFGLLKDIRRDQDTNAADDSFPTLSIMHLGKFRPRPQYVKRYQVNSKKRRDVHTE